MFVRVRETNLKHVILERSMQYVLTPDAGSVPYAGHVTQTAVVIDDDLGFSARKKEKKRNDQTSKSYNVSLINHIAYRKHAQQVIFGINRYGPVQQCM